MAIQRLLPITYVWMLVQGLLSALAPRRAIDLNVRLGLRSFENPGDLEPKDWYVQATRVAGVGMVAAGLAGLLTVAGEEDDDEAAAADDPVELDVGGDDGDEFDTETEDE
jgi:hypothetical protein